MQNASISQQFDPAELLPVIRYLNVLIDRYPRPTTLKQLSRSSKVSLAAVSKQRDKLFRVCDISRLASLRRSLLLKNDFETAARIGFTFYIDSNLGRFIRSAYAQTLLRESVLEAHNALCEKLPGYSKFFEEEDAVFVTNLAVTVITDGLDELQHVKLVDLDPDNLRTAIINEVILLIDRVLPNFSHHLKDQQTLEHVLAIRDKVWYLAKEMIRVATTQALAQFLATLADDNERNLYVEVYIRTANFYLDKFLDGAFTKRVKDAANSVHARWKPEYDSLGTVFKPTITIREPGPNLPGATLE